ncbi:MAG: hypothetical protein GY711_05405 [bacterium]|nr:hypothetical protein [bacterium]
MDAVYRLYPAAPTGPGTPTHNVDLTLPPSPAGQIAAGQTWYFQCWYRDPAGGGSEYNFSDGPEVVFCP